MHERITKEQYFREYAALLRSYARCTRGATSTKLIEAAERLELKVRPLKSDQLTQRSNKVTGKARRERQAEAVVQRTRNSG